jgi:uncharacterized protein DUF1353
MNIELSRRVLCKTSCAYALTATYFGAVRSLVSAARADTPEFPPDRQAIEAWMDKWMKRDRESIGALRIGRFADPIYFLLKPITWKPNPGQEAFQAVTVPVGFVTDFASIPRKFWSFLPPDGKYTYPAIVHDFLYWTQTRPKEEADKIFKFGMEEFGIGTVNSTLIYNAVYWFGSNAWKENAALKAKGEKRILKRFPVNPTLTWVEWKKLPNVFE